MRMDELGWNFEEGRLLKGGDHVPAVALEIGALFTGEQLP